MGRDDSAKDRLKIPSIPTLLLNEDSNQLIYFYKVGLYPKKFNKIL